MTADTVTALSIYGLMMSIFGLSAWILWNTK